ncbi:PAS domain S-box protein [Chryseosolibacter indicus]|uniref:PAS domain S-box protein n=1 Tax=Chryseosolibacter indicus TaxID=2782351 RepID=A0ABS5VPU7_9BACT|nr:PAS domain S-box protein [Chryseosolibacter indicus]MBT1702799.1 PAS domain S-box protein [Chryseosolibacter indicus]
MIKGIKISTKVTLLVLLLATVAVTAISLFTYDYVLKTKQEKFITNLTVIADNRAAYFNHYFEKVTSAIHFMQESSAIKEGGSTSTANTGGDDLMMLMSNAPETAEADTAEAEVPEVAPAQSLADYLNEQKELFGFEEIYLTSTTGAIATSTNGKTGNLLDPDGITFEQAQRGIYFSMVREDSLGYHSFAAAPVTTPSGTQLLITKINLKEAYRVLKNYTGLGETGEVILAQYNPVAKKISFISPLREDVTLKPFNEQDNVVAAIKNTLDKKAVAPEGIDYREEKVLETARPVNYGNIVLLSKIDTKEANGDTGSLIRTQVYAGIGVIIIATMLSMVLSRSLTRPLYGMRNKLSMVAQGVLPESTEDHANDEFGQMEAKVDELVKTLKGNADFAQRIGEGKYDTQFKPASENDLLGMSLINMRHNLIENERRDKERNWIVRGVAEISEILRMHDSTDDLGEDVIRFILDKIGAIQGAFYVINDENEKQPMIEMRASWAYNRKKYLKAKFKFAEGLVGQAAAEKDTILRTEIPDDYVSITSGILGDQRPKCILIVPLITNEEVYGILEFAGFKKFDQSQVKFVQELSLILARTIFNIKVNERTRRLLAESQEMSNELKEKQEVLRQNAEEMQATQEELQRSNQKLEEQIEEVNRTQKRMQLLLENASEVITIYEEDETIRYISPSVETILGYGQKEMIGKSDVDKVHPDHRNIFKDLFKKMIESPDEKVTVQYEYKAKDGSYMWIESTGTNCMANPAIHGYILNSRDITERRRAEQEQRMRSKMQALSENSPDLITRLEEGSISYINPIIEAYTGKNPSDFLNKNVRETALDSTVFEAWLKIVEEVNQTSGKVATEMDFPSEMGKRVMQVNAIPEFDETEKLESVLVVSHDITDRKIIELEIQNKNKKITESINYAKRIQTAILPNTRVINRALPDSFILYKPRDVVSGDFPWFVQIKDEIFIAAVDCTGHGVPGALLSLIGYFLLNDIVRSRKVTEPGKILDLLDEGVTTTLRQDEDATTKDGMDIALCKINMATGEVEYAGAHRPLYIMKNGAMEEVKGNKFPIGGGIFKNQTNFTNTKIKLSKGDSIYFSSDGFPDQFGGPEGRKFGPKRTREIIERVHTLSMNEAVNIFDHEWESWRGDHKQTDDVLLIGIKF